MTMLNMLRFQFRRLFKKSTMYICLLITAVFAVYAVMIPIKSIDDYLKSYSGYEQYMPNYNIKDILTLCLTISFLTLITAIFTAIFVCEDRSFGTIKTIYSKGYPRSTVFFTKYIASLTYITIYYAAVIILAFLGALMIQFIYSPKIPGIIEWRSNDIFLLIINQYLSLIAVNSLYYLISELVGKTGLGIALSIFAPVILLLLLGQIYMIIRSIFPTEAIDKLAEIVVMYYLPTLITTTMSMFGLESGNFNYLTAMLFNLGYIILFGGLSLLVTVKKQVKN